MEEGETVEQINRRSRLPRSPETCVRLRKRLSLTFFFFTIYTAACKTLGEGRRMVYFKDLSGVNHAKVNTKL